MNNHNIRLLITRPQEKGRELSEFLQQYGICCYQQTFFDYKSKDSLAQLSQLQQDMTSPFFIFVSHAAVKFADQCLALHKWQDYFSGDSRFFAVGKATAQTLESLGLGVITPEQENSEGLLALKQLSNVNKKNIIIIRGDGGREHLANTLFERGANIAYFESYQRVWRNYPQSFQFSWYKKHINCILITSIALLEVVAKHLISSNTYWQKQCTWLVISSRIAQKAQELGIKKIINCYSADHQAILLALKTMND